MRSLAYVGQQGRPERMAVREESVWFGGGAGGRTCQLPEPANGKAEQQKPFLLCAGAWCRTCAASGPTYFTPPNPAPPSPGAETPTTTTSWIRRTGGRLNILQCPSRLLSSECRVPCSLACLEAEGHPDPATGRAQETSTSTSTCALLQNTHTHTHKTRHKDTKTQTKTHHACSCMLMHAHMLLMHAIMPCSSLLEEAKPSGHAAASASSGRVASQSPLRGLAPGRDGKETGTKESKDTRTKAGAVSRKPRSRPGTGRAGPGRACGPARPSC